MGHPAAAGLLPEFDFGASDNQDWLIFSFSLWTALTFDYNSSDLDPQTSSWSIARLTG